MLLATAAGTVELKPGTSIERFIRSVRMLDTRMAFEFQIRHAIGATDRDTDRIRAVGNDTTVQLKGAARIRALIYELINLQPQPPDGDEPFVCDTPTIGYTPPTAHWIHASVDDTDTNHPIVSLRRTPAHGVIADHKPADSSYLSVSTDCPSTRLLNLADVLYDHSPANPSAPNFVFSRSPTPILATATTTGSNVYQRGYKQATLGHEGDRDLIASALPALTGRPWQTVTVKAGPRQATGVRA